MIILFKRDQNKLAWALREIVRHFDKSIECDMGDMCGAGVFCKEHEGLYRLLEIADFLENGRGRK